MGDPNLHPNKGVDITLVVIIEILIIICILMFFICKSTMGEYFGVLSKPQCTVHNAYGFCQNGTIGSPLCENVHIFVQGLILCTKNILK
jgi:hypothetical protein